MNSAFSTFLSTQKIKISIFALWLVTISGIAGIYFGAGDWFLPKTPLNLLLGAAVLFWNFPAKNWRNFGVWALVYLFGMLAEIVGVKTGWPFGAYHYGENLGLKCFDVPFLIGLNWVVLTFLTAYLGKRLLKSRLFSSIFGAFLMVFLDFFIEPVAPKFDFWHWAQGFAPIQNYVAWFVIAFAFQLLVFSELPEEENPLPWHQFFTQLVFFVFFYAY